MGDFNMYWQLGWEHIMSRDALDHQLFILALAAIYRPANWKRVLLLITAFTIGHSLTLALSVYNVVAIGSKWVEFLIPCTIMATALFNCWPNSDGQRRLRFNYWLAMLFGLVHGLGFANTIRLMLATGQGIGWPLLGFNIGLEVGQLVVVAIVLTAAWVTVDKAGLQHQWWIWLLSGASFIWAAIFAIQRLP